MKHVSTPAFSLRYARCGALLMALSAAGPAAWGQRLAPMVSYAVASVFRQPTSIALGDVTGDGRPDLVVVAYGSGNVGVLPGQAGGHFGTVAAYATGYQGSLNAAPRSVAMGDVNGDGRLDIVVANWNTDNVSVLLGQAGGGFAPVSAYGTGGMSTPIAVALGDVTGDGRLDIVTIGDFNNNVRVLAGQAGGGFAAASTYNTLGSTPHGLALGDLNGDGRLDIVTANYDTDNVSVLLSRAGGFVPATTHYIGWHTDLNDVALGDMNGDGRLDIVTANYYQSSAGVLLGLAGWRRLCARQQLPLRYLPTQPGAGRYEWGWPA